MNTLYYGDNIMIMKDKMKEKSVDLIYLDPPFNSKKDYNLLYTKLTGQPVPEQAEAFTDTWEMDAQKWEVARSMAALLREIDVEDYYIQFWRLWIHALYETRPHLLAYLTYMVQRLVYMKRVLTKTGSIYLHCDPEASHYIKIMMDAIFGHNNFRNEIIWRRTNAHNKLTKQYGPIHDVILFYTMSDNFYFNPGHTPYTKAYIEDRFTRSDGYGRYQLNYLTGPGTRQGESGKEWRGFDPTKNGRHWAIPRSLRTFLPNDGAGMSTLEALETLYQKGFIVFPQKSGGQPMYKQYIGPGVPYQDIWAYQPNTKGVLMDEGVSIDEDVKYLENEEERLGYPTQKPVGLLRRIITSSSQPGQTVFDPFCGCGTTVYAAQETGRQWIGCDIAILSIQLIRRELIGRYRLSEGEHFIIDGIPASFEAAQVLAKSDPFQFQHWFVEAVGGFPMRRKVADKGVDGKIYFETRNDLLEMVLSVKSGNIRPVDIRELRGVLEREEKAVMAGFLSLKEPSKAMIEEAAQAGTYNYNGVPYPRIQLLSAREFFEDKKRLVTPSKVGYRYAAQELLPL